MKNTSVSLGPHFADLVDRQVAQGRFASVSEVVRAGLRLLEDQEAARQALVAALEEGERSGSAIPFDRAAFLDRMRHGDG